MCRETLFWSTRKDWNKAEKSRSCEVIDIHFDRLIANVALKNHASKSTDFLSHKRHNVRQDVLCVVILQKKNKKLWKTGNFANFLGGKLRRSSNNLSLWSSQNDPLIYNLCSFMNFFHQHFIMLQCPIISHMMFLDRIVSRFTK